MQIKFLKEVVTIIVGKQSENIVDLLTGKNNVNEFLIAKKLEVTINQTRNILYRLSDHGLVSSIRKKDKKKGWYTYFWRIEILKMLEFLKNDLEKKINQLNNQIKSRETKLFYVCERCNIEFNEENALLHDFTCSECGNVFTLKDNSKVMREFKKELNKLKRELELVNQEIEKEKEKEEKKKLREAKKEAKEKVKAKEKIKKVKKKLFKKIKSKKQKKESKKKVVRKVKKKIEKKKRKIKKKIKPKKVKKKQKKKLKKKSKKKK